MANADHPSSWLPANHMLELPAYAQSQQAQPQQASAGKGDVRDLLNVASHELGGEVNKLKSEAFMRMQKYVQNHPDTIPGA